MAAEVCECGEWDEGSVMFKHKAAWRCHDCPQCGGPKGCPAWLTVPLQNEATGEVKMETGCVFPLLPGCFGAALWKQHGAAAELNRLRLSVDKLSATAEKQIEHQRPLRLVKEDYIDAVD